MSSATSDTFISYLLNILKTLNIKTLQIQHVKNKQQQQNSNLSSDINTIWNDVFYNKAMVNQIFKYLISHPNIIRPDIQDKVLFHLHSNISN